MMTASTSTEESQGPSMLILVLIPTVLALASFAAGMMASNNPRDVDASDHGDRWLVGEIGESDALSLVLDQPSIEWNGQPRTPAIEFGTPELTLSGFRCLGTETPDTTLQWELTGTPAPVAGAAPLTGSSQAFDTPTDCSAETVRITLQWPTERPDEPVAYDLTATVNVIDHASEVVTLETLWVVPDGVAPDTVPATMTFPFLNSSPSYEDDVVHWKRWVLISVGFTLASMLFGGVVTIPTAIRRNRAAAERTQLARVDAEHTVDIAHHALGRDVIMLGFVLDDLEDDGVDVAPLRDQHDRISGSLAYLAVSAQLNSGQGPQSSTRPVALASLTRSHDSCPIVIDGAGEIRGADKQYLQVLSWLLSQQAGTRHGAPELRLTPAANGFAAAFNIAEDAEDPEAAILGDSAVRLIDRITHAQGATWEVSRSAGQAVVSVHYPLDLREDPLPSASVVESAAESAERIG